MPRPRAAIDVATVGSAYAKLSIVLMLVPPPLSKGITEIAARS
jgi:hypothetical protein